MATSHRTEVERLIAGAAAAHVALLAQLPPEMRDALPVDAQGVTAAIDHLAIAAGLSEEERLELVRPHSVNPAVLHARVYGRAPLARETVIGSFVDGARVRAEALGELADIVGGVGLGAVVRGMLIESPPPVKSEGEEVVRDLRATYEAQERATLVIAERLDTAADG